jgi:hypothetical protein
MVTVMNRSRVLSVKETRKVLQEIENEKARCILGICSHRFYDPDSLEQWSQN